MENLNNLANITRKKRVKEGTANQYANYVNNFKNFCTREGLEYEGEDVDELAVNVVLFMVHHVELNKFKVYNEVLY
jgi:hypothetical protein